uniref:Uncharacterized protein n=1 Tax=Panagrolaimus superbus TaxID=310955 RepID=A0A914YVC4_9BILA
MEMIFFTALFVVAVNSYSIRPSKTSFDLLLPFNNPEIYYRSVGDRDYKRSTLEEDDRKIASLLYNILYETADAEEAATNNHKMKRDTELFSGQKRQSLRKSNFDILAGGGLGK